MSSGILFDFKKKLSKVAAVFTYGDRITPYAAFVLEFREGKIILIRFVITKQVICLNIVLFCKRKG